MIRKYGKFTPIQHRPSLPLSDHADVRLNDMSQYHYMQIAWREYWKMVRRLTRKRSLWAAHQKLQKDHPFHVPDMGDRSHVWHVDDFLLLFMWQFEAWQTKTYDMDKIYDRGDSSDWNIKCAARNWLLERINAQTTLVQAFELHDDDLRSDFTDQLWSRGHSHILEQIVDDPIYGHNAKFELMSLARSREFAASEVLRRSSLPENVTKIDEIISHFEPTNYSIHFPYPPNEYHNVPNCLCVLGDGGMIFRLEVLDPPVCSRFKFVEINPPWWGLDRKWSESLQPWEGEYDFPFYDFNIHEGDEFDFDKLMEVVERACEQIASRGDRKWGKTG